MQKLPAWRVAVVARGIAADQKRLRRAEESRDKGLYAPKGDEPKSSRSRKAEKQD
jgi:hypothetical protein